MSATIVSSTPLAPGAVLFSAAQTFALDAVLQCSCLNPVAGLATPCEVDLLLSADGGNTFVLVATNRFTLPSTQGNASLVTIILSDCPSNPISSSTWYLGTVQAPTMAAPKLFAPPWTNYMLRFAGNSGGTVTVAAVGDSGLVSVPTVTPSGVLDTFGTSQGSVLFRDASLWNALGPGNIGDVLQSGGPSANPAWGSAGAGTVSSVTLTGDGTVLASSPSTPVTTTGTLTAALATQSANTVLAGPASGSAANPTFRAIVPADGSLATVSLFPLSGSPYTVAQPAGKTWIEVDMLASGGGGGGGGVQPSGTPVFGGTGGGGGARTKFKARVADLTWPITLTIPDGGAGGAGAASTGTGTNGTPGSNITFGTYAQANGGPAGAGGGASVGSAGTAGVGEQAGAIGGQSSISTVGNAGATGNGGAGPGGGSGGGISAAPASFGGGNGGQANGAAGLIAGGVGGNLGTTSSHAGTNGTAFGVTNTVWAGSGAGGGGAATLTTAGAGAVGGGYASGGGGGGACLNGNGSGGAGGKGAPGFAIMVAW